MQTLLGQVDEGSRKKAFLQIDQTEYTVDNKQAMALLFILVERKDKITSRLTELENKTYELKEIVQRSDKSQAIEKEICLEEQQMI